ncbi:universal stress protein [Streptomyces abyssomicinicus]|uniref:universal stress protein n=1 Tax=Streptomyces abyssomicinicus TaxID=574929 RepID=UPI0012501362|nr:universal stress protein [Streptomyces abyssomicinicus]
MSAPHYVVAYGGDERSKVALRTGADLARSLGAVLDIVLVVRSDTPFGATYPPAPDVGPLVEHQAGQWLEEARASVPSGVPVHTHIRRHRSVAQGILEAAADLDARLVVVGTASGGGPGFTVGPVATQLLHASPVPVALVPRGHESPGLLERIYCAVGTRPGAQLVVRESVEAARRARLDLHLVSLLEVDEHHGAQEPARQHATELISAAARDFTGGRATVEIGQGRTMKQAVDSVTWDSRGVLLIGSSRLAPGRRTFLGTTAARILRHLPIPMVVVPHTDGEER